MLITRHAHTLIQADLTYANCKFEGMYHHHMMDLFSTVETIILQRKGSESQNLGKPPPTPPYTPKQRGAPTGGHGRQGTGRRDGNAWQRKERASEVHTNATIADQGDMASLQAAIGEYENTTTVFTSKNKVWCAPATPYAKAQCTNCNKEHWIDTPCAGGAQNSDVGAELRHSSLLRDMLTAMHAGTFKRLTHRFQGGKNGLPKHTSHKKATVAVTKIVADNGTDKAAKKKAKKERKEKKEKKAAEVRAAAAAVAAAEADSSDDDSGTDEDDHLTPVVLSQATRVGRTPGYSQQLPPPRAQRQHSSTNATGIVRSHAVTVMAVPGWSGMAIVGAGLARLRAAMLGATVRRLRARQVWEACSVLQAVVMGRTARQAMRLQAAMEAWRL